MWFSRFRRKPLGASVGCPDGADAEKNRARIGTKTARPNFHLGPGSGP
jgi:hypothetical protein